MHVLFEDNHLLVVDKPAGLLTQAAKAGDDTLVERARAYLKERWAKPGNVYVGLVHRLDRSTSGVVVLAKTTKAASRLSDQFRTHEGIEKRYLAVVHGPAPGGRLEHTFVEVDDGARVVRPGERIADAKRAVLEYEPLARAAPASDPELSASLIAVSLITGRKHQIRVQLAAMGHALFGDRRYGAKDDFARVALHASRLVVRHPTRAESVTFDAPIPDDLRRLCESLRLGPLPLP